MRLHVLLGLPSAGTNSDRSGGWWLACAAGTWVVGPHVGNIPLLGPPPCLGLHTYAIITDYQRGSLSSFALARPRGHPLQQHSPQGSPLETRHTGSPKVRVRSVKSPWNFGGSPKQTPSRVQTAPLLVTCKCTVPLSLPHRIARTLVFQWQKHAPECATPTDRKELPGRRCNGPRHLTPLSWNLDPRTGLTARR